MRLAHRLDGIALCPEAAAMAIDLPSVEPALDYSAL
jgi:hypothetical protein